MSLSDGRVIVFVAVICIIIGGVLVGAAQKSNFGFMIGSVSDFMGWVFFKIILRVVGIGLVVFGIYGLLAW